MCYSTCVLLGIFQSKQMSTTFLTWNHFVSGLVPDVSSFFSSPAGTNGETGPGTVGYLSAVLVFHQNWFLLKPSWQLMLTIADLIPRRYFNRVILPEIARWHHVLGGKQRLRHCAFNIFWFSRACKEHIFCELQQGGGWHCIMMRCNFKYQVPACLYLSMFMVKIMVLFTVNSISQA